MKHLIILFLIFSITLFACKSKVSSTICDKYNVYYNPKLLYYLVSSKKTPSGSFFIWETDKGLFLNKTGGRFYDDGPYPRISDAIEGQKSSPYLKILTWNEHKRSGNTLIEKGDGTILINMCE